MAGRGDGAVSGGQLVARLNHEWTSICGAGDEVAVWAARHAALRCCGTLDEVLTAVRGDPDGVLGALILETSLGSTTAARVVLQAMLGKVVLMARADGPAGLGDYLAAMWEQIRTYPIARRPQHIAANLALDTRKLARAEGRGDTVAVPWPPGAGFADVVDRQWIRDSADHSRDVGLLTVGDVLQAAAELELIDDIAENLLTSVYARGLSSTEAAREHHLTATAVRWRCSRAVQILAQHSTELAGAV